MTGLSLTVVNAGPLNPDKNKLIAFASAGTVAVPTTVGIIEHPRHGLILWDTGINDAVADPDRGEAYWGPGIREAFGAQALTRDHAIDAQLRRLGFAPGGHSLRHLFASASRPCRWHVILSKSYSRHPA